jgi:hypothetical protein
MQVFSMYEQKAKEKKKKKKHQTPIAISDAA